MSTDNRRETLSAVMDGEAGELELRRLLRDMDEADVEAWRRWQIARDATAGRDRANVPGEFTDRLRAALETEGTPAPGHGVLGHLSRAAVAASVAVAVIFGWQFLAEDGAGEPGVVQEVTQVDLPAETRSPSSSPSPALGEASTVSGGRGDSAATAGVESERINTMMMRHSESAARHGGQPMIPHVRFISLDAARDNH